MKPFKEFRDLIKSVGDKIKLEMEDHTNSRVWFSFIYFLYTRERK